jgi:multiple sugar transport system permease protein
MAIKAAADTKHTPEPEPFIERLGRWRYRHKSTITAYTILTPMLIYFVAIVWVPVILLFILSTMHWNIIQWPPNFVGLENYRKILVDPYYQRVFQNTVVLGLASLLINVIGGFSVALLLNQQIVGRGIFRTIWYIPAILSGAVMAQMMLVFLLPTSGGVMNMVLHIFLGMDPVLWQRNTLWMPIWVIVFVVWRGIGWTVIFFLAGLQSIDPALYEAAKIDGANGPQLLRYITVPQMVPIFLFVTVTGLIGSLQQWEAPMLLTSGGPENSTITLVYSMYKDAFSNLDVGKGVAQAAVLLLALSVGIGFQLRYYQKLYG